MLDYAIVCPGQGSQSPGMFDLAEAHPRGRTVLEAFSAAQGADLLARARNGEGLFENAFAQPAMVAAALATWKVLEPELPPPALFAGYSVGELSAWACAGAWDAGGAATAASTRARLMDAHAPRGCGMLAVRGLPVNAIVAHAAGLHLAIVNESDHAVLAGPDAQVDAAQAALGPLGAWTRRLDVRVPSHTQLMAGAAREFGAWLAREPLRASEVAVLRGIDGRRVWSGAEALHRAVMETIRWDDCMRAIVESGVRVVLELGPGRTLTQMLQQAHPQLAARSVSDFRSVRGIVDWLERQS